MKATVQEDQGLSSKWMDVASGKVRRLDEKKQDVTEEAGDPGDIQKPLSRYLLPY